MSHGSERGQSRSDEDPRLTVVQLCRRWLPLTMNWIFHHVTRLPETIDNHVVCASTLNLERFGVPEIHSVSDLGLLAGGAMWLRGLLDGRPEGRRTLGLLLRTAERAGADLVHSHFGPMGWFAAKGIRKAGLKHVVSVYGADVCRLPQAEPEWTTRYGEMFDLVVTYFPAARPRTMPRNLSAILILSRRWNCHRR